MPFGERTGSQGKNGKKQRTRIPLKAITLCNSPHLGAVKLTKQGSLTSRFHGSPPLPKDHTEGRPQCNQDPVVVLGLSYNIRPSKVGCAGTEGSEGIYHRIQKVEETRWLTVPHSLLHVLAIIKTP